MKRGPKPTAKALPKVTNARPVCPDDIDAIGIQAWNTICDSLEQEERLATTDLCAVEAYSRAYSLQRWLEGQLRKQDEPDIQLIRVVNNTGTRVSNCLAALKLTPKSRGKVAPKRLDDPSKKWAGLV
jgi:phage terminase small subunit